MATRRPLIVNAAANQIQELTDADGLTGNGTIPVGGIIMWSGTIANIPSGYALCNGSNGTPDLRNRFIVGATSDASSGTSATAGPGFNVNNGALNSNYTPGNTGGETAHQLTKNEVDKNGWNSGTSGNIVLSADPFSTDYHENRPPYYALAFIMRTI